jgi:hypothetical protein
VLEGAGCSTVLSTVPFVPFPSPVGLASELAGTSNELRDPVVPLRSAVGEAVLTGNLVRLASRR